MSGKAWFVLAWPGTIGLVAAGGTFDVTFDTAIVEFKDPACSQLNTIEYVTLSGTDTWSDVPVGDETSLLDTGDFYPTGVLDLTGAYDAGGLSTYTPLALDPTGIPEPTSLSLLGGGLIAFGMVRRRKRTAA